MSDDKAEGAPAKKKGGKLKKLILFVALPLVLVGGGVGGGLYATSGKKKDGPHVDPNRPKLMLRGEGGEHGGAGTAQEGPEPAHPDPAIYKSTYYPIEQTFTSNLRDTDGFLQLSLGVSTFYDSKVIDNLKDTEMPVRSAVLETLAQEDAEALNTPEGKLALRKKLTRAINQVLEQREGFGGIDNVYFTSFVIQ